MKADEQWIEETMNALEGINQAENLPFLYERIMNRVHKTNQERVIITSGLIWKIAACIALLICINCITLISYDRHISADQNAIKSVTNEYFSYLNTYNL